MGVFSGSLVLPGVARRPCAISTDAKGITSLRFADDWNVVDPLIISPWFLLRGAAKSSCREHLFSVQPWIRPWLRRGTIFFTSEFVLNRSTCSDSSRLFW